MPQRPDNGGMPGGGMPQRPDNGGGMPQRPDNGGMPGGGMPQRPDNGGGMPQRPDNGGGMPQRPDNGGMPGGGMPPRPGNGGGLPQRPGGGMPGGGMPGGGMPGGGMPGGGGGGGSTCITRPCAAPTLGTIGYTTASGRDERTGNTFQAGEDIYGPFEAGFSSRQDGILAGLGCNPGSLGHVAGGIDTWTAEQMVRRGAGREV